MVSHPQRRQSHPPLATTHTHTYTRRNAARSYPHTHAHTHACRDRWEAELEAVGLPAAKIQTWTDWLQDKDARKARVVADVEGDVQLGRTAWVASAGEYPDLKLLDKDAGAVSFEKEGGAAAAPAASGAPKARPLEGYVIVDFANVIAGPACGRMFAELGATVYKLGPGIPQHGPMVMMVWQAELHQVAR